MGLNDPEMLTTMTKPHRQLISILEGLGFEVEVEVSVYPYSLDCYLPELHLGFEADGPSHKNRSKDQVRDDSIMSVYAIPIYRITVEELESDVSDTIRNILIKILKSQWKGSTLERLEWARRGGF